jgi:16S rRNA (uracil1498-N3)-methyltransferase
MHRFYLPPELCRESVLELSREDSHHAAGVLRVRPGEPVIVLDGAGRELTGVIDRIHRGTVTVRVEARRLIPPPTCALTLIQGLVKAKAMDTILQKATELGATKIVPVRAARSVAHVTDDDADNKLTRWQATIVEAAKQCGAAWLPQIEAPVTLHDWLAGEDPFDLVLLASLNSDAGHMHPVFDRYVNSRGAAPRKLGICIGPEGDFTSEETGALQERGAVPVSLGPLVLRAETAALAALAIIGHELRTPRS